jgi:NHL repeat
MRRGLQLALLAVCLALALPGSARADFWRLAEFGEFGAGPGQLDSPAGAAVNAAGELFIADSGNDRVAVFAGNGAFLRTLRGGLSEPRDLALDRQGRIVVADSGNDRIAVLASGGGLLFDFEEGGEAALAAPTGVAIAGPLAFVADTGKGRIVVFEEDGEFVDQFPTTTPPRDLVVGPEGNLFVLVEKRVEVYTSGGTFIRSFGDEGVERLESPTALTFGEGQVFVADEAERFIERFAPAGDYLGGFPVEWDPTGLAVACQGNVFVVEKEVPVALVERFGEPGTPAPPCAKAPEAVHVTTIPAVVSRLRFNRLKLNRRNGSAVLFVRVSGPGRVILKGRGVRRLRRGAQRPAIVRLPVRPKVRLRRFIKRHGKGRIRVEVTFKPAAGLERSFEKVIVLRRRR